MMQRSLFGDFRLLGSDELAQKLYLASLPSRLQRLVTKAPFKLEGSLSFNTQRIEANPGLVRCSWARFAGAFFEQCSLEAWQPIFGEAKVS